MARIRTLDPPYAPQVAECLAGMMPPGQPPIRLFRTFARNLPMTTAMRGWGSYELGRNLSLSMREREIVIDRTCTRCGCEYEWGVHTAFFAERVGLSGEQVRSLVHGFAADSCWTAERGTPAHRGSRCAPRHRPHRRRTLGSACAGLHRAGVAGPADAVRLVSRDLVRGERRSGATRGRSTAFLRGVKAPGPSQPVSAGVSRCARRPSEQRRERHPVSSRAVAPPGWPAASAP
jgi:hypothetical protein